METKRTVTRDACQNRGARRVLGRRLYLIMMMARYPFFLLAFWCVLSCSCSCLVSASKSIMCVMPLLPPLAHTPPKKLFVSLCLAHLLPPTAPRRLDAMRCALARTYHQSGSIPQLRYPSPEYCNCAVTAIIHPNASSLFVSLER